MGDWGTALLIECLLEHIGPGFKPEHSPKWGMVVHAYNSSTQDVQTVESDVQDDDLS